MITPKQIANNYLQIGTNKTETSLAKTFVLAIMAGIFIALAGVASSVASLGLDTSLARIVKSAVFPLGLILVVCCGSELFTGDCLLILPLLGKRIKLGKTALFLAVVYAGNFVGSVFVALLVRATNGMGIIGLAESAVAVASAKCSMSFGKAFLLGIACNVLVCLAVWMSFGAESLCGKIFAVYFPIFAFVVCGFEHSVANMYYLSVGMLFDGSLVNLGDVLLHNMLPVTLGNILGGALIGIAYYFVYLTQDKRAEN